MDNADLAGIITEPNFKEPEPEEETSGEEVEVVEEAEAIADEVAEAVEDTVEDGDGSDD